MHPEFFCLGFRLISIIARSRREKNHHKDELSSSILNCLFLIVWKNCLIYFLCPKLLNWIGLKVKNFREKNYTVPKCLANSFRVERKKERNYKVFVSFSIYKALASFVQVESISTFYHVFLYSLHQKDVELTNVFF